MFWWELSGYCYCWEIGLKLGVVWGRTYYSKWVVRGKCIA